jgi:NAD(P)-dependent dehydrogenase (short-subunit alcohol dehydrogenase family)
MDFVREFRDRQIFITGAASGIGLAAARLLAQAGVGRLFLSDIAADTLSANTADLGVPTELLPGDVSSESWWTETAPRLAAVDAFILNAGVSRTKPLDAISYADWRRVVAINLDGVFLGLQTAMRALKARGQGGSIVVTGSTAAVRTDPGMSAYGVSKAAVHHLVRIAAREGTQSRIRVNAVAPGGVATPIWRSVKSFNALATKLGSEQAAFDELGKSGTPLGKYTSAEEIAGQLLFLLSDACSTVTGTIFVNDGGFTL